MIANDTLPAPIEHPHYMRPLDGLRGLACLMVVLLHITYRLPSGNFGDLYNLGGTGVSLFFVLSGFLMSMLYKDEAFTVENAGKYAIARFSRIAPAYWIAIICAWILYTQIPDFYYQVPPFEFLRLVFFAGNAGVFWSIPPEVQFYGFFLLLWCAWQRAHGGKYAPVVLLTVLCAAFVGTKDFWGGLMLPSKLHLFLAGFLAAFLVKNNKVRPLLCSVPAQIVLALAFAVYAVLILQPGMVYKDLAMPCIIGLLVASLSQSTIFTKPLETHMMRMLGAASFSIYLFHDMTLRAMDHYGLFPSTQPMVATGMMCLIAIAAPVAFHYIVETRLNRSSKKRLLEQFARFKSRYKLA